MKTIKDYLCLVLVIACFASVAVAQNVDLDRDDFSVAEGDWSNDDNWVDFTNELSGVPTLDLERWARIPNGSTAILEDSSDTGGLEISGGTVDIRQGGSLKVDATSLTDGVTTIGNGTLRLSGSGAFDGKDLSNNGTIDLGGESSFGLSGNFTNTGDIHYGADGDGKLASMTVKGDVDLAGALFPAFASQPQFGDSFAIITGASSVTDNGAQIVLSEGISFGRGLSLDLKTTSSTASLEVTNVPILTVNRVSGAAAISNVEGNTLEVTGYSIFSDSGLLKDDWSGLGEGWTQATPRAEALAELNLTEQASLEVGGAPLNIGTAYNAGPTHPDDEDVRFEVSLADGSVVAGSVEYEGPPNNLALLIDPKTGEAKISHKSGFIDPFEVTGYQILSESGALKVDNWNSLAGDEWTIANPNPNSIAEFNPSSSLVFANGNEHALGAIFDTAGLNDVVFEFATVNQILAGTVVYVGPENPLDCNGDNVVDAGDLACSNAAGTTDQLLTQLNLLPGDLDGDGTVAFADFLVLSTNFNQPLGQYNQGDIDNSGNVGFPDFLVLSTNFNKSSPGAVGAAVPEPTSLGLLGIGTLFLLARCRYR